MDLHKCPRRFVLGRLRAEKETNIHFAYGGSFGVGLQALMSGETLEIAIWEAFLAWPKDFDLMEEKLKDKKSFWYVITMLEKFNSVKDQMFLDRGWEVATFNGKPAAELGARIEFGDGFYYLLFIDLVLINRFTNELKVFELKTTKYDQPSEALYANSWQAILYSIFLDAIAKEYSIEAFSSYEVLYFIAKSSKLDFEPMPFKKTSLQKAKALQYIFQDITRIQSYEEAGSDFPMYGESCFEFSSFKPCQFFGTCHMSLPTLSLKSPEELEIWEGDRDEEKEAARISFTLHALDLIEGQLK